MKPTNPNKFLTTKIFRDFLNDLRNAQYSEGINMILQPRYTEVWENVMLEACKNSKTGKINEPELRMRYDLTCQIAAQLRINPDPNEYCANPVFSKHFFCKNPSVKEIQRKEWQNKGARSSSLLDLLSKIGIAVVQVFPDCEGAQKYYHFDSETDKSYTLVYPLDFKSDAPPEARTVKYPLQRKHITDFVDTESSIGQQIAELDREKERIISTYRVAMRDLSKKRKKLLLQTI